MFLAVPKLDSLVEEAAMSTWGHLGHGGTRRSLLGVSGIPYGKRRLMIGVTRLPGSLAENEGTLTQTSS